MSEIPDSQLFPEPVGGDQSSDMAGYDATPYDSSYAEMDDLAGDMLNSDSEDNDDDPFDDIPPEDMAQSQLPGVEPLSDIPVLSDRQEPRTTALVSSLEIVQAVPADAEEIGLLRAHNWREQYAHLNGVTEEWMAAGVERIAGDEGVRSRAHWIERATQPAANNYWLIARTGNNALAGFLEARRYDDGTQELRSLHLAPSQRGAGIGQALLDAAHVEWFDPAAEIFLDVAEVNEAGQRFYSRSPNNYQHTGHRFFYGPIAMLQMKRERTL